ncbi:autotransporter domain-containing protein [Blastomonas sp.]|uniref:autotransporter outer membrane beta-barrel domain-containing protein n=1 Tax=Blastomonas sp. TaxID=1909299 RepID=UPI00263416E2|nr:autotransporter outer membrane beta-barrel domain-containing protein [Blastomonas sp.]MDM7956087.1 autotransporter domain-containing protein [Blastomonas sp.]
MRLLLACTCLTPISLMLPHAAALAQTSVTTARTTPIATSSANNGAADSIRITSTGSVKPASGVAVTIDSNHNVTNEGTIQTTDASNSAGILAVAGTSGTITNSGVIVLDENYTPTDTDNDGDIDGPYAQGQNRFGIRTLGALTGSVIHSGSITIEGNTSAGISLEGPLTGSLVSSGTISMLGDNSAGMRAGAVSGNVALTGTIAATGANSMAVSLTGPIGGALTVQGTVTATGYRTTTPPADPSKLDADDLLQGGPALQIAGSVAGGILFDAPPPNTNPDDKDEDKDGIDDDKEGTATVTAFGSAAAVQIGSTSEDITIGAVAGTAAAGNGLVLKGRVVGSGVYKDVAGNGLVIGGLGHATTITGGVLNTGAIGAQSNGGNATAIRIGNLASVPALRNTGAIEAAGGSVAGNQVRALVIDAAGTLTSVTNTGKIAATAAGDGSAAAIVDLSGSLRSVENTGAISAVAAKPAAGRATAIDLAANTTGTTIRQSAATPTGRPSITGDIRLGSGDDLLEVNAGTVTGAMLFGAGSNRLTASGEAALTGDATFGSGADTVQLAGKSALVGKLDMGGGNDTLAISGTARFRGTLAGAGQTAVTVSGGSLSIASPGTVALGSLAVADKGLIGVTIDGQAGTFTKIDVAGAASFAEGSRLGVTLVNVSKSEGTYQVLSAGSLTGSANIVAAGIDLPFLFKSTVAGSDAAGTVSVDIKRKTATELSLSGSQARAYDAVFKALDSDAAVAGSFLAISNAEQAGEALQQMLPDHAGGTFATVTQGSRATARFLTDTSAPYSDQGGWGFWLQQTVWGSAKDRQETASFDTSDWGATGGVEIKAGDVGRFGVSLAYLNGKNEDNNLANEMRSNQYELAAHWRGDWGPVRAFARGSFAQIDFDGTRRFAFANGTDVVERVSDGEWSGQLYSASAGLAYEAKIGRFALRPSASIDYYRLDEDGYAETGGGDAFNLTVDKRSSDEIAVNGTLVAGYDLGSLAADEVWLRVEVEGGRRQIIGGSLGETTARFKGGETFTLIPDARSDGWIGGLRLVGGQGGFSLAGELGGEEQYDRLALNARVSLRVGF